MAINFTDSPADGATQVISGRTYTYNSAKNKWDTTATEVVGPTATTYATVNDLPGTALTGDQAFVSGTNRLYIWNGSGWYNIALVNSTPTWSTQPDSSYTLASDGTATTITIVAVDPEGLPITYSIASDTSGNIATVAQGTGLSANTFTITPSTSDADAGTFSLTFRASDGVNIASAISEFTLAFSVQNSNYTTALITSVGTNNQVNNAFVDSSSNSHTITAAGNATQTTFSPYRHGGYSTYFDGSGDYLTVADAASLEMGSSDFTVEIWVYCTGDAGTWQALISKGASGIYSPFTLYRKSDGNGYLYASTNGTSWGINSSFGSLLENTWYHIALVRSGDTWTVYKNGASSLSATLSGTAYNNTTALGIGSRADNSEAFKGYLTDIRVVNGTAVYTSAFTPPTERLTAITNTSLLTCHLPYITDGSTNSHAITVNGNTKTEPFAPYDYKTYSAADNGGSMYFSDGNAYLTASPTAPGTGDFCYECWINVPQATDDAIFDTRTPASSASGFTLTVFNSSTIRIFSDSADITASGLSYLNQWTHLCVEKVGSTTTLYVNGTSFGTTTAYSNMSDTSLRIGESPHYGAFSGHIADFRYVRGGYVYNGNFTPPTAPLTAISGTEVLINGTNAGIIDKSQTAKTLTLAGNTKSSTTQTKYLSSSMYFDGSGDRISFPGNDMINISSGDFTVEGWVHPTTSASLQAIFQMFTTTNGNYAGLTFSINRTTSTTITIECGAPSVGGGAAAVTINSSGTALNNAWSHIAFTREGNTFTLWVNGASEGTDTFSGSLYWSPPNLYIGSGNNSTPSYFTGYLSDFRITKGLARYTANFTPPAAALQG